MVAFLVFVPIRTTAADASIPIPAYLSERRTVVAPLDVQERLQNAVPVDRFQESRGICVRYGAILGMWRGVGSE